MSMNLKSARSTPRSFRSCSIACQICSPERSGEAAAKPAASPAAGRETAIVRQLLLTVSSKIVRQAMARLSF